MCWNITRVSLWLLCNMHVVQIIHPTIAAVQNIDAPVLTCVCQELEYRIAVCAVTGGAHSEHLQLSKKKKFFFQFSCCCEKFH